MTDPRPALTELLAALPALRLVRGQSALRPSSICIDSRRAEPGSLFVAMRGARVDGHDYLQAAIARGASALLVESARVEELAAALDGAQALSWLAADEPRAILGELASLHLGRPADAMELLGITGTNGKTTCSFLLEAIYRAAGRSVGVIGTINYRWPGTIEPAPNTTPESLTIQQMLARMRADAVEVAVMEVSSHGLAMHRVEGCRFDGALWTNLSQDHLDFHPSMEAYFAAKARLFRDYLGSRAVAVLNLDDRRGAQLQEELSGGQGAKVLGFGRADGADYRLLSSQGDLGGLRMEVGLPGGGQVSIESPMVGTFNEENLLGVIALAHARGVSEEAIVAGLAQMEGVPGRLQRVEVAHSREGGPQAVFVDYAHSPDALRRSLETLRGYCEGRLVVVFGAGGDRDRGKRAPMAQAASALADVIVLTSDNPRGEEPGAILDDLQAGLGSELGQWSSWQREGRGFMRIEDRAQAIALAVRSGGPRDVVLVAGKGHETYQEIGARRLEFDDRLEVLRALQEA